MQTSRKQKPNYDVEPGHELDRRNSSGWLLGIMKAIALKTFVGLFGAFAVYYAYFLGSVFYELYGPSARFCGTAQVWALQGGAVFFAPPALLGSVGLWFAGRRS